MTKKVMWNGVEYASIIEAAEANGVNYKTLYARIQAGYTCDADMPGAGTKTHKRQVAWNGIEYASIAEAARAVGVEYQTMHARIQAGYTSDDDMPGAGAKAGANAPKRPVSWNGVEYESVTEAAAALGIPYSTLWNRIQAGYSCDDDMIGRGWRAHGVPIRATPITWEGIEYASITAAARAKGMSKAGMWKRVRAKRRKGGGAA